MATVSDPLTVEVLDGYLRCKYLGFLRLAGQRGTASEFAAWLNHVRESVRDAVIQKVGRRSVGEVLSSGVLLTRDVLSRGAVLLLGAELHCDGITMRFHGLQRVPGTSMLGDFQYVPIRFGGGWRLHRAERVLVEVLALLLADIQGVAPRYGLFYQGPDGRPSKVRFSPNLKVARDLMQELSRLRLGEVHPRLLLNDHCPTCEFCERCREQAVREDNLSLLRGLGQKAITAYARKGILTLTQLAHTFRPRRNSKRSARPSKKRHYALQALALRDHCVYVFGTPEIPTGDVRIYLDLEGLPEDGFVYLIGMIVCEGATKTAYSFWADDKNKERSIVEQFLNVIARYDKPRVYSYGGYERAFLKRMRRYARRKKLVDLVLDNLVNVLGIIYAHFYFPAYTNGLKDIGRVVGCTWAEERASGIQSVLWRRHWESTHDEAWKAKLLAYNQEDCAALHAVTEFLQMPKDVAASQSPNLVHVHELDKLAYSPKWGPAKFANSDFAAVNSRAYFDYQQQRVFIRTSRTLKKHLRKRGRHHNGTLRANKRVEVTAVKCPMCKSKDLRRLSSRECEGMRVRTKRSLDLVITGSGIHRRVTECWPVAYQCGTCGHRFKPDRYQRVAKHGHALMSWAMNGHVAHRLSLGTIEDLFRELFGLCVNDCEIHMFKNLMARYYRPTYDQLLAKLTSGSVLHVDETEVHLRTGKGYVWVFASIEEVAYMYKPSREAEFLKGFLNDFHGVLVSDFYAGYDGLPCPQQKCLIHLIRDLNQALLESPYNAEVQSITQAFGTLLRSIVATVDECGLKHNHLARHEKTVTAFFQHLASSPLVSEPARTIQDRLLRYRDRLFTFLQHDNVPWNNNNAENAIKQFAYHREDRSGLMREAGLRDYLMLLSIYQTCRYRGITFLQFLLSGARDIDAFTKNPRQRRRQTQLALYPKGFTPPHFASTKTAKTITSP